MRRSMAVSVFLCVLLTLFVAGCRQSDRSRTSEKPSSHQQRVGKGRLSVAQAEELVAVWVKRHRDKCYWHDRPKLKEVTTREIRDRLDAQVFRMVGESGCIQEVEAYLMKDGKVYPMSHALGGWGLMDMCVCDINGDSKDDLIYTYSWGSGMHRSEIEAYDLSGPHPRRVRADFMLLHWDAVLKKRSEHEADLYGIDLRRAGQARVRLGRLTVSRSPHGQVIGLQRDPRLTKAWKDSIWSLDSSPR